MSVRDIIILGCSSQQPTRERNHGAYLVRWNGQGLLFDPGEGTQRQFIFASVAPTCVNRIFISHFHGDHCLGFGSMLMRLNLDKVTHPIHCYYPASGQVYFERLRYSSMYHEKIHVIPHPVKEEGLVHDDGMFRIEARFLDHGVDNIAWRVKEADVKKFDKEKLRQLGIDGPLVKKLAEEGTILHQGQKVSFDQVGWTRLGDTLAVMIDTSFSKRLVDIAKGAKLLLCESTYLERHKELAKNHLHLTAKQAAWIAKQAGVEYLILTHFSARYFDLNEFAEEAKEFFPTPWIADDLKVFPFPR